MNARLIKLMLVIMLAGAVLLPAVAVKAHEGPHIRFAHFSTGTASVDIYLNDKLRANDLKYKAVSDYASVDTGTYKMVIVPLGGKPADSLTKEPFTLKFAEGDEGYYTIAIFGSPKDNTLEVLQLPGDGPKTDHAAAPAAPAEGKATVGTLEISGAWARATAKADDKGMGGMNMGGAATQAATQPATGGMAGMGGMEMGSASAIYLKISNKGDKADKLISANADVAGTTEIHETVVKDNVASMQPVKAIEIAAKGSAELKPGGLHIMLLKLKQDLKAGDMVNLTLKFESGATVTFKVPVRNP